MSKKKIKIKTIEKIVRVVRATYSGTKEKKKARKARKEKSSSKEELGRIETLDKNSNLEKEYFLLKVTRKSNI